MSIKKISSSSKNRINNMFVNQTSKINQIHSIQPIRKIKKIDNYAFQSSQNNFFGSSYFYEHLKKLKKEYLHFYRVQQELEDTLKKFIHPAHENFITMIKELISKYNKAIISLKDFDYDFNTNHCQNINDILLIYQPNLEKIGITLQKDYTLSIDETICTRTLKETTDAIQFLFDTKNGFIKKLYHAFKEIKVPSYNDPYTVSSKDSHLIINEKH
ncbi:hypothetical protein [Crassaminicella profunda]|uniref:hypothetical protein n=1 Tax=Crassaminicella profunda TaxID=1286698 RepID=UPI001CA7405C|nr:hypothetical protein [Crassaminicella profunda]QZY56526.1 hypothetical protein K7H06_06270 [Crassaminicella profunda]